MYRIARFRYILQSVGREGDIVSNSKQLPRTA